LLLFNVATSKVAGVVGTPEPKRFRPLSALVAEHRPDRALGNQIDLGPQILVGGPAEAGLHRWSARRPGISLFFVPSNA
jgi:hypothetical protein